MAEDKNDLPPAMRATDATYNKREGDGERGCPMKESSLMGERDESLMGKQAGLLDEHSGGLERTPGPFLEKQDA